MTFPEAKRVVYKKNPLKNVICQLRFPPILKIDAEVPANFQEKIRNEFPLYRERTEVTQPFMQPMNPNIINQFLSKSSSIKTHEFLSTDEIWKAILTRTFISLSTSKYTQWEHFFEKLNLLINSMFEIYSPPFFTRVGLRYIDVFNRQALKLEGEEWKELLNPSFLGLLSESFGKNIRNCESVYEIK